MHLAHIIYIIALLFDYLTPIPFSSVMVDTGQNYSCFFSSEEEEAQEAQLASKQQVNKT